MILDWIFQSSGKRTIRKIRPIVDKINQLEDIYHALTRDEILIKINNWKSDIQSDKSNLDDILPDVFAAVREASKRTIKKRHFDVQLIGGYIIHKGMVAEMKTGEGKTLVATLPAILNALTGKTVFVVTVNDYLAKRDCELLRPIYEYLGFTVNFVLPSCNQQEKHHRYSADIVYITNNEICFDYLRDNMAKSMAEKLQKHHYFAIIDEIDNILIDESRTPLIISGPDNENSDLYDIINPAISLLDTNDYDVDIKSKNVTLKNSGFDKIEAYLTAKHLINNDLFSENIGIYHVVSNLVKAHKGMMRDKDYVVYKDEVIIVDEFTGRLAFGRKFSNGLHQALEAKEHVTVRKSSKTNAFISYTNFFRLFKKIGGMTGTGLAEADELDEIYNLKVVGIPTNMPVIRKDDKIFKLYLNKHTMYEDALIIIKEKHQQGQPLLLCTPSVFDSEMLSEYLQKEGIQHSVLNAKNHEQEASIVAQAGRSFSITIATNMAGRGTDILLGGCVESAIKSMLQNNQDLPVEQFEEELSREFKSDKIKVEAAGGLCVVLLGALESKKSEIQFIGRAGRQGDPGESIKFVSLEDDVLMNLSKDAINRFLISLYFTERCNTNSKAQEIVTEVQDLYQSHYFEIRRNMLKYDDVINFQRKAAYEFRDYIMSTDKIKLFIKNVISIAIDDIYTKNGSVKLPLEILKNEIAKIYSVEFADLEDLRKKTEEIISKNIDNMLDDNLRSNVLNLFDEKWYELINELENLKRTIHLVSYEQKDPVFEFRQSAFNIFKDTINEFRRSALENFTKEQHTYSGLDDLSSLFGGFEQMPCFCGSGKKFKECHGNMFGDSGLFGDNNMIANMDFSKLNEMLNEDDEDDQDHESINNQAKTTDFNLNNIFNIDFSKHHTEDLEEKNTQFIDNSSNTDDHQPKEKHEIIIEKKDDEAKSDNQNYIDRRKKTDKTSKNTDNTVDNDNNIKKINNKKKKDVNEQE